jgi:TRAP-type C4-dicarboxylate transport system permease small subunit
MEEMNVLQEVWRGDGRLKWWFVHSVSDLCMTLGTLALIWIFWEGLSLMRFWHFPEDKLAYLENLDFFFMVGALKILGCIFLIKLVIGLWPKSK